MRKLTVEGVIILILWVAVGISYLVSKMIDTRYVLAIIGLAVLSIGYSRFKDHGLVLLLVMLSLAVVNLVRFTLAFNLMIGVFNIFPLVLLVVLVSKRRKALLAICNRWLN